MHTHVSPHDLDTAADTLYVVVPTRCTPIDPRSGAVATFTVDGQLVVDAESNRYGAANLTCWADRVAVAADRHRANYPTVARWTLDPAEVTIVGTYLTTDGRVELDAQHVALVAAWTAEPLDSLTCYTSWAQSRRDTERLIALAAAGDRRLATQLRRHIR